MWLARLDSDAALDHRLRQAGAARPPGFPGTVLVKTQSARALKGGSQALPRRRPLPLRRGDGVSARPTAPSPRGRWTRGAPPPGRLSPEAPPSAAPREAAVLSFGTGFRRPRPQRPLPRAAKRPQTLPRKGPAPNPSPGPRPLPAGRSGPPTGRAHDDSSSRPTCSRSSLPGPTRSPSQAGPRQPAPSARVWLRLRLPPGFTRIRDRELV